MKKVLKVLGFGLAVYGTASLVKYEATKYWKNEGPYIKAKVKRYFVDSAYDALKQRIETSKNADILRNSYDHNRKIEPVYDDICDIMFHFGSLAYLTLFVRAVNTHIMDYGGICIGAFIDIYKTYGDEKCIDATVKKLNEVAEMTDGYYRLAEMPEFEVTRDKDSIDELWTLRFY